MLWIFTRLMNLALTLAALAAGVVVSGGVSKASWARLATNDLDLGALNGLAQTNSIGDGVKVIWAAMQPLTDRISAMLQGVKEDEGQQVAGMLNRELETMRDALYSGDFVGLAVPIAMVFAVFLLLRFLLRMLLRKTPRGRTARSEFEVV